MYQQIAALFHTLPLLAAIIALSACQSHPPVPVVELGQSPYTAKTYTVQKGDTLYAIAFRFSMQAKQLAAINGISAPYTIYPKQILQLYPGSTVVNSSSTAVRNNVRKDAQKSSSKSQPTKGRVSQVKTSNVYGNSRPKSSKMVPSSNDKGWLWPVRGKVIEGFSTSRTINKGIDISAAIGSPIVSSRSGVVVYAGSRLKGYGNLIIVKHSDDYLTAYAHNKSLLVKEGDSVKQGQKIATLGKSSASEPKLHFEVRKQGKPVNPLRYLTE